MELITENKNRNGNFTSGEIHKLIPFGSRPMTDEEIVELKTTNPKSKKKTIEGGFSAAGLTYIEQTNMERRLLRSLDKDITTNDMSWGDFVEMWVFKEHLDTDYEWLGKTTLNHPTIPYWVGSPDYRNRIKSILSECKGYQLENFCRYADAIETGKGEILKNDCPKEWWQGVSNCIITGSKYFQPVLFCPYQSQLPELREFANGLEGEEQLKYEFIFRSADSKLCYLMENGYYKNYNTCIIEVPQSDKDFLTSRVIEAGKLLNEFHKPLSKVA